MFYKNETLALVIDGPNTHSMTKSIEMLVDWAALLKLFREKGRLIRATYLTFTIESEDGSNPMVRLLDFLQYNGFDVVSREAKLHVNEGSRVLKGGSIQVDLAITAMKLAEHADHIVLFVGDSAYVPLIAALQEAGTRVTVCGVKGIVSDSIRRQADNFIEIDKLRDLIAKEEVIC